MSLEPTPPTLFVRRELQGIGAAEVAADAADLHVRLVPFDPSADGEAPGHRLTLPLTSADALGGLVSEVMAWVEADADPRGLDGPVTIATAALDPGRELRAVYTHGPTIQEATLAFWVAELRRGHGPAYTTNVISSRLDCAATLLTVLQDAAEVGRQLRSTRH